MKLKLRTMVCMEKQSMCNETDTVNCKNDDNSVVKIVSDNIPP